MKAPDNPNRLRCFPRIVLPRSRLRGGVDPIERHASASSVGRLLDGHSSGISCD